MFAARPTDTNASAVISVSQLNRSVRDHLERRFPLMWIAGEISNFRRYDSGHCYFTLKDADAQVRCVMFRTRAQHLDWEPQDGMQVDVRALVSIYEPRGDFQLNIEAMRRSGLGPLYERFVRLKAELDAEGVFDAALKRPIPAFAQRVGVITSLAAAALRDILSTLARRNPSIEVILYPVPVQGEGAAQRRPHAHPPAKPPRIREHCARPVAHRDAAARPAAGGRSRGWLRHWREGAEHFAGAHSALHGCGGARARVGGDSRAATGVEEGVGVLC